MRRLPFLAAVCLLAFAAAPPVRAQSSANADICASDDGSAGVAGTAHRGLYRPDRNP
jgi:hypothetical protein